MLNGLIFVTELRVKWALARIRMKRIARQRTFGRDTMNDKVLPPSNTDQAEGYFQTLFDLNSGPAGALSSYRK